MTLPLPGGRVKDPAIQQNFEKIAQQFQDAIDVAGARDDPEGALLALLTALETVGIITDSTTPS